MPLKPSPLQPSSRPLLSQSFTDAQAWTHAFSWGHQRVAKVADCVLCLGSLCLWVCLAGQAWYLPGATVFGLFCAPMSRGFGERSGVTRTVPGARTKGQCSTRRGASRAVLERRMGSSGARKEADRGGRRGSCRGSRPPPPHASRCLVWVSFTVSAEDQGPPAPAFSPLVIHRGQLGTDALSVLPGRVSSALSSPRSQARGHVLKRPSLSDIPGLCHHIIVTPSYILRVGGMVIVITVTPFY